jgi:hypothetical protein
VTLATACALVACIPSAGFALGAFDGVPLPTMRGTVAKFTPASIDPRMAKLIARNSSGKAQLMRFTPAGVPDRGNRSVTVAVRVDGQAARAITVNSAVDVAQDQFAAGSAPALRIAPMRYNLGMSRGYQSFAKIASPAPALSRTLSDAAIPDLAQFRPSPGVRENPSRFVPRNAAAEPAKAAAAPRAVESHELATDQAVDLAGSYRLTRNLDVTAGVRYRLERDRLAPVADTAQADNQAVYVGTQFRF